MDPGSVSPELSDLSYCEEMPIARAFPVTQVYVRKAHNTIAYKGHVLTLPYNVKNVASILSQCPKTSCNSDCK